MNERQAWNEFWRTGSVSDYLRYRRLCQNPRGPEQERTHAADDRRSRHSGNEYR